MTNRPHDALFKAVFGQAEHARGLFLNILPESLCTAIAWETLILEPGSFVDEELADSHSDLLFATRLEGAPAYIYLLLEHQSTVDGAMPLRMYNYLGRIWQRYHQDHPEPLPPLPPVVPIVVSHAVGGWTASVEFQAMFEPRPASIPGLAQYVPQFSLVLVDLAHLSNEELRDRALGAFPQLALWLLRDARDVAKLFENLVFWVATFRQALAGCGSSARVVRCVAGPRGPGPKPQLYRVYFKVLGHRDRGPEACMASWDELPQPASLAARDGGRCPAVALHCLGLRRRRFSGFL